MKIAITTEIKRTLTVSEMPEVQRVIEEMKEDSWINEYAEMAARVASKSSVKEILKARAEIAKNCRVRDAYHEGSDVLDVWLNVTAYTEIGVVMVGAYLTDIWALSCYNKDEIRSHMYIRLLREER